MLMINLGGISVAFADSFGEVDDLPAMQGNSQFSFESQSNPLGELSEEEISGLLENYVDTCPTARHIFPGFHTHEIIGVTNTYMVNRDRGVIAETLERVPTTTHLSVEQTVSISNRWNVNIGFDKSLVVAELGFDVEATGTRGASFTVDIPEFALASITLYDVNKVSEFDVKTVYIQWGTIYSYTEYGEGWAEQWDHFGYTTKIY